MSDAPEPSSAPRRPSGWRGAVRVLYLVVVVAAFVVAVVARREEIGDQLALTDPVPLTASVVAAQAFGVPAFPVDTHIHRLAHRWRLSNGKNVVQTEKDLKAVFPKDTWNKVHLQIIFFGREYCPALYHDLSKCPICSWAAPEAQWKAEERRNRELRGSRTRAK